MFQEFSYRWVLIYLKNSVFRKRGAALHLPNFLQLNRYLPGLKNKA